MNARVYDPNIGRFTSADPIGFAGGINLYGYAGGNPLVNFDLSGEEYKCGTDPWCTSDRFTKSDADTYWRTGDIRPMIVNARNVDLSYIPLVEFPRVGESRSLRSPLGVLLGTGDARIYGSVTVYRVDEDYVRIFPDSYNFELHNYTKPEDVLPEIGRNIMTDLGYVVTSWGGMYNNQYHGYEIIFDGLTPISK